MWGLKTPRGVWNREEGTYCEVETWSEAKAGGGRDMIGVSEDADAGVARGWEVLVRGTVGGSATRGEASSGLGVFRGWVVSWPTCMCRRGDGLTMVTTLVLAYFCRF